VGILFPFSKSGCWLFVRSAQGNRGSNPRPGQRAIPMPAAGNRGTRRTGGFGRCAPEAITRRPPFPGGPASSGAALGKLQGPDHFSSAPAPVARDRGPGIHQFTGRAASLGTIGARNAWHGPDRGRKGCAAATGREATYRKPSLSLRALADHARDGTTPRWVGLHLCCALFARPYFCFSRSLREYREARKHQGAQRKTN
jgi:hypothetical protein